MNGLKYKVGDRVRIKSLDWYNKNKIKHGDVWVDNVLFTGGQSLYCGCELTIRLVTDDRYYVIENDYYWTDEMIECKVKTLKYNVGDKVRIKSLDWYNKNKDEDGDISCGEFNFVSQMSKFCGKILTIDVDFEDGTYLMKEDTDGFVFTNEMFDTFAEEEVERLVDNLSSKWVNEVELPDGYIFKDENGNIINAQKIVLEKKSNIYPKTYEECSAINGAEGRISLSIIGKFTRLINARNAYWRIAGQEMGLGKPWEPDVNEECFSIARSCGEVLLFRGYGNNEVFEFPTPEMRDAFYEYFKEEIEICKELL